MDSKILRPEEVDQHRKFLYEEELKQAVKDINNLLATNSDEPISISSYSEAVKKTIMEKLSEAGWRVERGDGMWNGADLLWINSS